ncbi:hypothetical protein V6N13_102065 [Hibiscus sabdariffa]
MAFRLITQSTSLWARFLRAKYKFTTRVPASLQSHNYSSLWKGMSMVWTEVCPKGVMVADMATGDGEWRWEAFQHLVPNFVLAQIAAVKGPCPTILMDDIV